MPPNNRKHLTATDFSIHSDARPSGPSAPFFTACAFLTRGRYDPHFFSPEPTLPTHRSQSHQSKAFPTLHKSRRAAPTDIHPRTNGNKHIRNPLHRPRVFGRGIQNWPPLSIQNSQLFPPAGRIPPLLPATFLATLLSGRTRRPYSAVPVPFLPSAN